MDDFDRVCLYAKEKNKVALTHYIKSGGNIGVLRGGMYSPIMQLAREGDGATVDFLTNYFPVSLHEAVQGAVMGSAFKLMQRLLAQGASVNYAIRGAGILGCHSTINTLLDQGAHIYQAIIGAAIAGHGDLVDALLRLQQGGLIHMAVFGAALGSAQAKPRALMNTLINYRGGELGVAVCGAAMAGQTQLVDGLVTAATVNTAMHGAALGGCEPLIKLLLSKGASKDVAAKGLATGGHGALLAKYLANGANINFALTGAAAGWHLALIHSLLKKRGAHIDAVKQGIASGSHDINLASMLRLLVFLDNDTLRKRVIDAMDWQQRFPTAMLFAKANYMHECIQQHHIRYDVASSQFDEAQTKLLLSSALKPAESHVVTEKSPPVQACHQQSSSWHLWRPSPDQDLMSTVPVRSFEMTEIPLAPKRMS